MIPLSRPVITEDEKRNVLKVLNSGMLASGDWVEEFEKKFSSYIGTKFGIATSSGTTALHTALLALDIGPGDIVITTPFSFIATANAILYCGAQPLFADINPATFNISPESIEEKIKSLKNPSRLKALLITHLFGLTCQMDQILKIVRKYKLKLIEDCAQATGAEFKGKKAGSFGHASVFSFYSTKNLISGEGGMVLTSSPILEKQCRKIINHGRSGRFIHDRLGYNYRFNNIAAAISLAQLKKIDQLNAIRVKNAHFLSQNLQDIGWLSLPFVPLGYKHVFHQYTLKLTPSSKEKRDHISALRNRFVKYLQENGISAAAIYPKPIHRQPFYYRNGYKNIHLPEAEKVSQQVVSIPVHPLLKEKDLKKTIRAIKNFVL